MFIYTICCQCKYHRKCMQGKNVWASQGTCGHSPYLHTHQIEPSLSWCSWHSLAVQRSPSAWSSHSYLWGVEWPWMILATGQQRGEVMWYGRKQIINGGSQDNTPFMISWSFILRVCTSRWVATALLLLLTWWMERTAGGKWRGEWWGKRRTHRGEYK